MGLFDRFRGGAAAAKGSRKPKAGARRVGIYVHIPFCVRKCRYCDFVSYPAEPRAQEPYFKALRREIAMRGALLGRNLAVDTIFFGGGTPSLPDAAQITGVLGEIFRRFAVLPDAEITLEANPGTVDGAKLNAYRAAGFTRISLGVQSFDDGVLNALERIHTAQEAEDAVRMAKEAGFDVNIDLMFGVPGQTLAVWRDTLQKAIALQPQHLSYYSLQLEEGTPLYEDYRAGRVDLPSREEDRAMYHAALEAVRAAGYEPYEISNAALPGMRCRHNLKYWTMGEYLGFGLAAHSFLAGRRFANGEDSAHYLMHPGDAFAPQQTDETGVRGDYIFTRLRLLEGFPKAEYEEQFDESWDEVFGAAASALEAEGLLEEEDGTVRLTARGLDHTNLVMERLLAAIPREDEEETTEDEGGSDE